MRVTLNLSSVPLQGFDIKTALGSHRLAASYQSTLEQLELQTRSQCPAGNHQNTFHTNPAPKIVPVGQRMPGLCSRHTIFPLFLS